MSAKPGPTEARSLLAAPGMKSELRIVCKQMGGPGQLRLVEIHDANDRSVTVGKWRKRKDGLVALVITELPKVTAARP